MAKIRLYKLAKELGITNEELIAKAEALRIEATNHMSSISDEDAELIRVECSRQAPKLQEVDLKVKEVRIKPGVIRRRRTVVVRPPPEMELEEPEVPPKIEAPVPGSDVSPVESALEPELREHVTPVQETPDVAKMVPSLSEPMESRAVPGHVAVPVSDESRKTASRKKDVKAEQDEEEAKLHQAGRKKGITAADDSQEEDKRRQAGRKRKVVEYTGWKKKDVRWNAEQAEPEGRTGYEPRREKRPPKRIPQKPLITTPKSIKRKVRMGENITVGDLARRLSIKSAEIIKQLLRTGVMATINQPIDRETAILISSEYGYEVENIERVESQLLPDVKDQPENLLYRPPVVTIMGHVNHGKTRLLDTIRKTNVMEKEAGGITQHIGAYTVNVEGKTIVFLDTPGHEAFTKMRARGAKVTDIVVLVVAGDDGVMPQTVEAIHHAKAAKVPIIVAVNKIDLPAANVDKVKQGLSEHGLLPEDWGGDTLYAGISAKQGTGIAELLEYILLQAEMIEQKANPFKPATGVIIEARLDRTLGPVATVLVQSGTLRVGDPFVTGIYHGRVRALINDKGERIREAGPSIPVEVLGWSGAPEAGDMFYVVEDDKTAKVLSSLRLDKARQAEASPLGKMSLEDLYEKIRKEEMQDLNIVLKADVQGSIEALGESLTRLSNKEITVRILHGGVGGVTETDVMLASASNAIIIGFNVRAEIKTLGLLQQENVDARFYTVIYDAVADLKSALAGMMKPVYKEVLLGHAEVRETFFISRVGTVAGSHVLDGKIDRNAGVRVLRDNVVVHDGKLASLRRFKDDVREVSAGYECGIRMENFNDVKPGDILESYVMEKVSQQVDESAHSERRPG